MWIKSVSLPVKKIVHTDKEGFQTENWEYMRGIRANFKDPTRQEELLANQRGYRANIVVEIVACVYNGASFLVDEATGEIYDIKRAYCPDKSMYIQLTGERRECGGF